MPSTSKDDTDKDDTDKDDTKTNTGPVDQNPDVDGYQSTPPKDTTDTTDTPVDSTDTVPIVPPVVPKPKANVTINPNAEPTTKKKDTSRKVRPGMKGSSKQPARWNWKGPDFNPANFRDPLNLKKYKAVGKDAVVGSIANKKQF